MSTLFIQPQQSLIEEIIPHLKVVSRDYSSNLVVFPGRRPSHFLRKAIAERVKGSFIPPALFSIDEFIDYIYERIQLKRRLEPIDAVAILYNIQIRASKPVGGNKFITPDTFFSIGLKIYQDIEELYIEGVDVRKVKEIELYADGAIPEGGMQRLESLSLFYEEFYRAADGLGFSTRSLRYRKVSEEIDEIGIGNFQQIVFAGLYAFTKSETTMFRKLLSQDNVLFIFQHGAGLNERVKGLGIGIEDNGADSIDSEVNFYSSPDTHGQVFALGKILETRLGNEKGLDEKTVIVLPSPESLFPLLHHGLSLMDKRDYNVSLSYPLYRTPISGFMNNLMGLIDSMDDEDRLFIPDYLKFVLHPYTKNIYYNGNAEITRIMFHTLEEAFVKNREKTFMTLEEIENNEDFIQNIKVRISESERGIDSEGMRRHLKEIHQNSIEKFFEFKNVRDFAERCMGLLAYIFNNSTARLHPLFYPFSESFLLLLNTLSGSLMRDISFAERGSYFRFFRKYIMGVYTPFEGTPLRGLQVLGFLETRNLKFDTVFILDANEDILPSSQQEDTFLPLKAREILGLPTYRDRDRLAEYYFDALLRGAREVHIFFIEGYKKERSRFVEKLIWENQKQDRAIDRDYVKTIQYKVNLENKIPEDIPKTEGIVRFLKDFTYSTTSLNIYLECQLKFYYTYVLNLSKKEEVSGDIERTGIGSLVHEILSEYLSKRMNYQLKEADIDIQEIELCADNLFKKKYGESQFGTVYLLKKQIKNHLKDFLGHYYIPLIKEKPVIILGIEEKIPPLSIDSFKIKGRLDTIEKRGEKRFIIDFKIGAKKEYLKIEFDRLDPDNRASWYNAIGSFQLPVYLMLYSHYTKIKINNLNAMFLLLGRSVINKEIELPFCDDKDIEKNYGILKDIIVCLLKEIVDGEIPFKPTQDRKNLCPGCDFQHICGTQWIVNRSR